MSRNTQGRYQADAFRDLFKEIADMLGLSPMQQQMWNALRKSLVFADELDEAIENHQDDPTYHP